MAATTVFPYYQLCDFSASICGQSVRVISKPGLPNWDEVTPAVQLLAEAACQMKAGHALVLGCGNGALGVALSRQDRAESLQMVDPNWAALRVAKLTMRENGYSHVPVEPLKYPLPAETFQTVVMILPKGRKLARRWLVETWEALHWGGELYLAGANPEGIQSVIRDAGTLFGNASVLSYRKGCRVARMVKQPDPNAAPDQEITRESNDTVPRVTDLTPGESRGPMPGESHGPTPSWAAEPGIASGSWIEFTASVCGESFCLCSLPGVFSMDGVDEGTALLLQQFTRDELQGKRALDFGCGYGLIGIVAARLGAAWVDMLDIDLTAVAAAQENCSRNHIFNTRVLPSDVMDAVDTERYNLILSNPPFHAGKKVEYRMAQTFIAHSHSLLLPGSRLVLVANRFIPYDRLMREVFGNVEKLVETGKFHVLGSVR